MTDLATARRIVHEHRAFAKALAACSCLIRPENGNWPCGYDSDGGRQYGVTLCAVCTAREAIADTPPYKVTPTPTEVFWTLEVDLDEQMREAGFSGYDSCAHVLGGFGCPAPYHCSERGNCPTPRTWPMRIEIPGHEPILCNTPDELRAALILAGTDLTALADAPIEGQTGDDT